jgi:peptidoglycan/LPS O-acetylase OafA/YrhL
MNTDQSLEPAALKRVAYKINQLTLLRFIAAAMVLVFHTIFFFQISLSTRAYELLTSAASFFFVLSGFVLGIAWAQDGRANKKAFYRNRFVRIYPLYFIALTATVLVMPDTYQGVSLVADLPLDLFLSFTMTQSLYATKALVLNQPGWTLSVEIIFSLLFPFAYSFFAGKSTKFILSVNFVLWLLSTLALGLIARFGSPIMLKYALYFPAFHLSSFLLGIGASILFIRHNAAFNKSQRQLALSTIALSVFWVAVRVAGIPLEHFHHSGLFNMVFVALILWMSCEKAPLKNLSANRWVLMLGESCYGIYLLQLPLITFLGNLEVFQKMSKGSSILTFWGVLVLISIGCFYLIERPVLRQFRKAY